MLTITVQILSTYISSRTVFLEHAKEIMKNIASFTIDKTESHLSPAREAALLTSALASNDIVTNEEINKMENYFYEQLFVYSQFSGIYYGNSKGDFVMASEYINSEDFPESSYFTKIISTNKRRTVTYLHKNFSLENIAIEEEVKDTYDPRKRPWFTGAAESRKLFWASPYVFSTSGKLGITAAYPVFDKKRNIKGVIGVDIEIDEISDFISTLKVGDSGKAFILDISKGDQSDPELIAYPQKEQLFYVDEEGKKRLATLSLLEDLPAQNAYKQFQEQTKNREPEHFEFIDFDFKGKSYHAMFTPFSNSEWSWLIGIYLPEDDYIGVLKENRNFNIYFAIIMAVIASISGVLIASTITKPILLLQKKANEIIEQKSVSSSKINTVYLEIQQTADHFDIMQKNLFNYKNRMQEIISQRTRELENSNSILHEEIDNRKYIEKQLIDARNRADQANKAKSAFLANISHEIRTPLNGIIGLTEMLSQEAAKDETNEKFQIILRESDRLMDLLNRLLDLSKIESGELELEEEPFNLKDTIENVLSAYEAIITEKSLKGRLNFSSKNPPVFLGDGLRISQIFINLISNAVKFTEHGSISIAIDVLGDPNSGALIKCSITDTGIGIDKHKINNIFHQYNQAENNTFRKYGGTGLGIPISSQLIEIMGGKLEVSSKVGLGTEFSFSLRLPFADTDDFPQRSTHSDIDIQGTKVLIVEDYDINRKIAAFHLERAGCSVTSCTNGKEAVELFRNNTYEIILMDIQMPIMDGLTATEIIRAIEGGISIPIIGITANAFVEDIQNYLSSGMDDMLIKPFRRLNLLQMIRYWKNKPSGTQEPRTNIAIYNSDKKVFDFQQLKNELENDLNSIMEIVNGFMANAKKDLIKLDQELETLSDSFIHRTAHSIKGGAMNIFAIDLSKAAEKLEKAAKKELKFYYRRYLKIIIKKYDQLQNKMIEEGISV